MDYFEYQIIHLVWSDINWMKEWKKWLCFWTDNTYTPDKMEASIKFFQIFLDYKLVQCDYRIPYRIVKQLWVFIQRHRIIS